MGDSDKLPESGASSYPFVEHRRYLDALLDSLGVAERVTFVIHDWGSALGFDWANRHRDAVKGIAYMEALVRPATWADFPDQARPMFEALRSPAGEAMVLEQNMFVERALPGSVLRQLTDEEMAEYRRPFLEAGEGRRPTLSWPRQIPIGGDPPRLPAIVGAYAEWVSTRPVPKLFIKGEPGAILSQGPIVELCRSWPEQKEISVAGIHYLQEDSPDAIGQAIADWLRSLG